MEKQLKNTDYIKSVMDALVDMVRVVDIQGKILLENEAMQKKLGNRIGKPCYSALGNDARCANCISCQAFQDGKIHSAERTVDDHIYYVTAAPMRDKQNRIRAVVEVFRDVTANVKLQKKLISTNAKMLRDLDMARQLQRSALREAMPQVKGYHFERGFFPCESIGGDMYDCFALKNGKVLMYVADVSGHGVMPAMLTIFIKQEIFARAKQPGITMPAIMEWLCELYQDLHADSSIYITLFMVMLEPETGQFQYINAGHSVLPLIFDGEKVSELEASGVPISLWFDKPEYELKEGMLNKGGRLLLFTDGINGIHTRPKVKENLYQLFGSPWFDAKQFITTVRNNLSGNCYDDLTLFICEREMKP